jgi:hypothetical protein
MGGTAKGLEIAGGQESAKAVPALASCSRGSRRGRGKGRCGAAAKGLRNAPGQESAATSTVITSKNGNITWMTHPVLPVTLIMTSVNYIYMFNNKVVYFQHVNCIRDWGTFLPQPYSVLKRNVSNARVKIGTAASLVTSEMWTIVVPSEPRTSMLQGVLCRIKLRRWLVAGGSVKPARRRGWYRGQRSPPLRRWDERQGRLLASRTGIASTGHTPRRVSRCA